MLNDAESDPPPLAELIRDLADARSRMDEAQRRMTLNVSTLCQSVAGLRAGAFRLQTEVHGLRRDMDAASNVMTVRRTAAS